MEKSAKKKPEVFKTYNFKMTYDVYESLSFIKNCLARKGEGATLNDAIAIAITNYSKHLKGDCDKLDS